MFDLFLFWEKAEENLKAAQLCYNNVYYNASVNRAYYAMYHAAVAILIIKGFSPSQKHIDHGWVQSTFVRELINRKKFFQSKLRSYLLDTQNVRNDADYRDILISKKTAKRQLMKSEEFIHAIKREIENAKF